MEPATCPDDSPGDVSPSTSDKEGEEHGYFHLWYIRSTSLLAESDDVREIVSVVQSIIDDVSLEGLDNLNLSDATSSDSHADNSSGQETMTILQEYLVNEVVPSPVHS
jgi:hypothetical protein